MRLLHNTSRAISTLVCLCGVVLSTLVVACGARVHEQVAATPGDDQQHQSATGDDAGEAGQPPSPLGETSDGSGGEVKNAPPIASGTVRLLEKVMEIKSAVAVWDTKNNKLEFYLYPFELTPEDIEKARTMGDIFVVFGKSSPNPDFWPDWSPLATVRFEIDPGTTVITPEHIKSTGVVLGWLEEKNSSFSSHLPGEPVDPGVLKGSIGEGKRVSFHIKGEISGATETATYDLSADCEVLICGPPRCP